MAEILSYINKYKDKYTLRDLYNHDKEECAMIAINISSKHELSYVQMNLLKCYHGLLTVESDTYEDRNEHKKEDICIYIIKTSVGKAWRIMCEYKDYLRGHFKVIKVKDIIWEW